ncbi:MAG: PorV/PorQ family protein [bacterium]
MMKRLIFISIFLFISSFVWAKNNTGATFLKINGGARPAGMGDVFCAVANDVNALYFNPAGLAQIKGEECLLTYTQWFEDVKYNYLAFAQNISRARTIGGNVTYLRINDLIGRDDDGDLTGNFDAYDLALGLAYAERLSKHSLVGLHLKSIYQLNENTSGSSIAIDFGWLYKNIIKDLDLGLCIQNIGTKIKFIKKKEELPLNIKVGLAYKLPRILIIAVDGNIPEDGKVSVNAGTEITLLRFLSLRTGYKSQTDLDSKSHWSYGVGLKISDYQINYAFVPYGILGDTHRVSLLLKFL